MLGDFFRQTLAVADAEVRKVLRDPTELFSRAVQPILWLVVFGRVFGRIHGIPTGGLDYTAFLAPGILAQSVLFSAIFYGIGVIWERDLGVVHKLLVSPAYRGALVLGKGVAAGVRGVAQTLLIYVVVALLGIHVRVTPGAVLAVLLMVVTGSAAFAMFSLLIACLVRTRERFMGIGQLMTMPLFFTSNAIYPLSLMPFWLRVVARVNPLTYMVDGLRGAMVVGGVSVYGLPADFGLLAAAFGVLWAATTRAYPSLVR